MKPILALLLLLASASEGSTAFYAAAGKADITPDLENETIWLAGYGAKGRRATGVRGRFYARGVVFSDGKKTVAMVAVDSIGIYRNDVLDIRRELGWERGDRSLFLAATHSHAAPDTLGLWGRFPGVSGVDRRYHRRLKKAVVDLVKELSGRLREAELSSARVRVGPEGFCRDLRDPVVIDTEMNLLSFRAKGGGPIGTVVRYSCHPEVMDSDNFTASADFPGPLCAKIERETGGECAFFPGTIGGLMSPDTRDAPTPEGDFAAMDDLGERLADEALAGLKSARPRSPAAVDFSSRAVRVPIENSRYLFFLRSLVFGHTLYERDGSAMPAWKSWWYPLRHLVFFPLPEDMRPLVETEVSLIRIGELPILGIPGEMFPELAIGGYGGEHKFSYPLVGPANENPPDFASAPKGPYLRELLGAEHGMIVGLANDMIGYIVPEYDFQFTPNRAMHPRPPGTHYEETNSIGKSATGIILNAARGLLEK